MTRHKRRYLALEGVDGVGKTTICQEIVKITGWCLLHSPSPPFNDRRIREAVDRCCNRETRALFYRTAVQHDARWIVEHLSRGWCVVSDRSPLSTWIYGFDELVGSAQYEPLFWRNLPCPDYWVVLTASQATRISRLQKRREQGGTVRSEGERFENDQERQERLQERMIEVGRHKGTQIIATDTMEAADIAGLIVEATQW